MERKNIFRIDRALEKRTAKDLLLRSVMAFALIHQPTQPTAVLENSHHSDSSARREASERASVFEDKASSVSEVVVFPLPIPETTVIPEATKNPQPSNEVPASDWILDPEISFYGPGLYGRRTACGLELTKDLLGVAHRTLDCGTPVTFEWQGKELTVPVVDRGPYVSGRIFDLTGGACVKLNHCFTGQINYKMGIMDANWFRRKGLL